MLTRSRYFPPDLADSPPETQIAKLQALVVGLNRRLVKRQKEIAALRRQLQSGPGNPQASTSPLKQRLPHNAYVETVDRLRSLVHQSTPPFSNIVVVSKGDDELLKFKDDRRGWHFPQQKDAIYAGHHPADSGAAISHLEELRGRGAHFLVFPATAFWWLQHYSAFQQHLRERYQLVVQDDQTCLIFDLRGSSASQPQSINFQSINLQSQQYQNSIHQIQQVVDLLLPEDASIAIISKGDPALLSFGSRKACHFPSDDQGTYLANPADGPAAVAFLQQAYARGVQFLIVPGTAAWWLDYYAEFTAYLNTHSHPIFHQSALCFIFELLQPAQ